MENDDIPLIWEQFVKSAELGTKKETAQGIKIALCKTALKLSDKLIKTDYNSEDRFDLWFDYVIRVFAVLEGNDDIIKTKTEGSSVGNVCDVKFSGSSHRFYIKFHERGPQSSSLSISSEYNDANPPLIQEIFIYKLLSLINVGGEVHFPFPITFDMKQALFIATEEIKFTIAKELNIETANADAMILVCFIQDILRLKDLGENVRNFGQIGEGKPVIVDFWVTPKDDYVLLDNQVKYFWEEVRTCCTRLISDVFKKTAKDERKKIVHEAVAEWDLLNKIDEAKSFVEEFVSKNEEKLEVTGDLNRYVCDVKSNVENFLNN